MCFISTAFDAAFSTGCSKSTCWPVVDAKGAPQTMTTLKGWLSWCGGAAIFVFLYLIDRNAN